MNEDEWLTGTDFSTHVRYILDYLSPRRQRLLAVAFCRAVSDLFDHPDLTDALDVIDRYADSRTPDDTMENARWRCRAVAQEAYEAYRASSEHPALDIDMAARLRSEFAWAVSFAATRPLPLEMVGTRVLDAAVQAHTGTFELVPAPTPATAVQHLVMRATVWEVAGNPFREPHFSPEWRTDTVVSLARQVYDLREFSAMPILADALQDAGCDNEELLAHCRGERTHVRGCWVLDLVLEK